MERIVFAYLILAAMIAAGIGAAVYYYLTSRERTDRLRIRREDKAWNERRAELDGDDASSD